MSRRKLEMSDDAHTELAVQHAAQWANQGTERLVVDFELATLTPSPLNPRRLTLDNAGLSREVVLELARKQHEEPESWRNRVTQHINRVAEETGKEAAATWHKLLDLSMQLLDGDLTQPIIASEELVIIAGERRWLASLLAGLRANRVIIRHMSDLKRSIARFVENTQRDDLTLAEEVFGLRAVLKEITGAPCSPDNKGINVLLCQKLMGKGQTQAWEYSVLARLPEAHTVLDRIKAGAYTRKEEAVADAQAALGDMRRNLSGVTAETDQMDQMDQDEKTPAKAKQAPAPKPPAGPTIKMRLPGTQSGKRFLEAVSNIPDLPDEVVEHVTRVTASWADAAPKARKKMLADVLNTIVEGMEKMYGPDDEASEVQP